MYLLIIRSHRSGQLQYSFATEQGILLVAFLNKM